MNIHGQTTLTSVIAPANITTAEAAATATSTVIDMLSMVGDGASLFAIGGPTLTGTVVASVLSSPGGVSVAGYAGADTTDVVLRNGVADNITLGIKFTPAVAAIQTIDKCYVRMKKAGTVASGSKYIKLEVQTNNSGVPSNTAIATAATIDPGTIPTSYTNVMFTFSTPVELTSATIYHFVLSGDYDASETHHIKVSAGTVASGGTLSLFDAAWGAIATQKVNFSATAYAWSEQSAATVTDTAAISKAAVNFDDAGRYMRGKTVFTPADANSNYFAGVSLLSTPQQGLT